MVHLRSLLTLTTMQWWYNDTDADRLFISAGSLNHSSIRKATDFLLGTAGAPSRGTARLAVEASQLAPLERQRQQAGKVSSKIADNETCSKRRGSWQEGNVCAGAAGELQHTCRMHRVPIFQGLDFDR